MGSRAAQLVALGFAGSLAACLLPSYEVFEGTGGGVQGGAAGAGGTAGEGSAGESSGGAGGDGTGGASPGCLGDGSGPTLVWSVRLSGEGTRYQSASAVGPTGEVFVIGTVDGTLQTNGMTLTSDGPDPFLVRVTPSGAVDWAQIYEAPNAQFGLAVAVDGAGTPFIGGTFMGTDFTLGGDMLSAFSGFAGWAARLESDGTPNRAYGFSGVADQGIWALSATSGSLFLAGNNSGEMGIASTTVTSAGEDDVVVSRLFAGAGNNWAFGFGDDERQIVRDMAAGGGSLFLVGTTAGPGPYDADDGCPQPLGDDAFLFEVTLDGDLIAADCWGGAEDQEALGVKVLPDGKLLLTGQFFGTIDLGDGPHATEGGADGFVVLLNEDRTVVWKQILTGAGDQRARAATVDDAGNIWIVGDTVGSFSVGDVDYDGQGGTDAFLLQLDGDGALLWGQVFGGVGDQALGRIFATPDGALVMSGTFSNDVAVCGAAVTGGSDDAVVLELRP